MMKTHDKNSHEYPLCHPPLFRPWGKKELRAAATLLATFRMKDLYWLEDLMMAEGMAPDEVLFEALFYKLVATGSFKMRVRGSRLSASKMFGLAGRPFPGLPLDHRN